MGGDTIYLYEGTYTDYTVDRNGSVSDNVQANPTQANRVRGIGSANVSFDNNETMNRVPIDSLEVDGQGRVKLLRGQPHITTPHPPEMEAGCDRLLNIFRPYGAQSVSPQDIFPILERAPLETMQGG